MHSSEEKSFPNPGKLQQRGLAGSLATMVLEKCLPSSVGLCSAGYQERLEEEIRK